MSDIIDINVSKTVEVVEVIATPNLTTINVNTITGGGTGTSKPNKLATVTLSDIGIVTTTYTKSDLETAVTAYRQTLPMDVIFDIVVVKNVIV